MKHFAFLLGVVLFCFACNPKKSNSNNSIIISKTISPDTVSMNFLFWYKDHLKSLDSFYFASDKADSSHIINARIDDTTYYYSVNYKGVEKFLQLLKSSNCLSDKFVNDKRRTFKERSKELEKARQFDGPPIGFSAEEVFYTNETEHIFSFINKVKIDTMKIIQDRIDLRINLEDYKFEFQLSKYGNQWLIDEIK